MDFYSQFGNNENQGGDATALLSEMDKIHMTMASQNMDVKQLQERVQQFLVADEPEEKKQNLEGTMRIPPKQLPPLLGTSQSMSNLKQGNQTSGMLRGHSTTISVATLPTMNEMTKSKPRPEQL